MPSKFKYFAFSFLTLIFAFSIFMPQARSAAPTTGLVGYWNFDEASSGSTPITAADFSGNNNTGALTNGPTWTTGKVGIGAIQLDGVNDYVQIRAVSQSIPSLALGTGPFSISFWMKDGTIVNGVNVISAKKNSGWSFAQKTGGVIRFTVIESGVNNDFSDSTTNVSDGQWHHIV